jgi:hypothetical protein
MRYNPTDIPSADLETALSPAIGGEAKVYVSETPWGSVGDVLMPAENSGILTLHNAYSLPGAGKDLALIVDRAGAVSASGVLLEVTFNVTFDDNTGGTAKASYAIPGRAGNQGFSLPRGAAIDVIPVGGGNLAKKIKQVNFVTSVAGGAANNRFELVALPELASYYLVGCTNQANFKLPVGSSLPIPCGLNPSRYTKRGRGEPGTLNVIEKYSDYLDGLTRLNGLFVTAMVEISKDERVLTDRFVLSHWHPMASPQIGDGDDIATADGEGNFSQFAVFTAR